MEQWKDWRAFHWEQDNLIKFTYINTLASVGELSKKFALLMEKRNVNGALKLLTSNMSSNILGLDNKTLSLLKQKHPSSSGLKEEI